MLFLWKRTNAKWDGGNPEGVVSFFKCFVLLPFLYLDWSTSFVFV